jgi:hypothetical protein
MSNQIELHKPNIGKDTWGDGPWQKEPDKIQWIDDATDLDCLMVRGPGGHWCGYVGVPPEHPWHGVEYSASVPSIKCDHDWHGDGGCSPESVIDVHGGLTFSRGCPEQHSEFGICHVPQDGRPDNVWWFGFDCAHCDDASPSYRRKYNWGNDGIYRTVSYVQDQCALLAKQLKDVANV